MTKINYHLFFEVLKQKFSKQWYFDSSHIEQDLTHLVSSEQQSILKSWCELYHWILERHPYDEMASVKQRLQMHNPNTEVASFALEKVWKAIAQENNWQPFKTYLKRLRPS